MEYTFEVWMKDGSFVASVHGPDKERAFQEAMHYAAVYGQDGLVEVREVLPNPPQETG